MQQVAEEVLVDVGGPLGDGEVELSRSRQSK
jgi:hypothetical protein